MFIQNLYDYFQANQKEKNSDGKSIFPPYGYSIQRVSFVLSLTDKGIFDSFEIASKKIFLPDLGAIDIVKTSNPISDYFYGTEKYVLGSSLIKRVFIPYTDIKKLDIFVERHKKIYKDTNNQDLKCMLKFLETIQNKSFNMHLLSKTWEKVKTGGNIIIKVGDRYLHEQKDLKKYWDNTVKNYAGPQGRCMITGEKQGLRKLHGKIKGLGGAAGGCSLISFNQSAHLSYEKGEGPEVPIGNKVEFGYRTALNYLLFSEMNHSRLGDDAVVFWTEGYKDNFFCAAIKKLFGGKENEDIIPKVKSAVETLKRGKIPDDVPDTGFCLAVLSPNNGRVFLREYLKEPLKLIVENVAKHYSDVSIEGLNPPSLQALAWASLSGKSKKETPPKSIYKALVRAIMRGENYPISLAMAALSFCRKPEGNTSARLGLLKAYLNRIYRKENQKEVSMGLDQERTSIGYLLGRLLAVAERIQSASIGHQPNRNYGDKYRISLGATPSYVFKDITDLVAAHLSKLRKKPSGYTVMLDKIYSEIFNKISNIPTLLEVEEQLLFPIGYQHQYQSFFNKKEVSPQATV